MGKRYYCDYCDRSFQDNMHNRKKHLYGVQHHRSKKAWFDNFRDAAAILYDEQTKKPCRKFLQTGQCVFGNNCRFSHMSERDMENLRMQIEDERRSREDPEHRSSPERSIEEWLTRREKKRAALSSGSVLKEEDEEDEDNQPENDIPPHFLTIPDLPPSLLPPPPGGWKVKVRTEWG
ncbi:zinc finger matrin-type protein 5 isoform X1 [Salmo salar]|uniref:Zinc finger matrin-type protein 5 n=1 Tax=Salmo salar TaxID=8030 RepID=B5DG31_SALSA|nr:zinc finger matrin-type protein 5 [Salmo salar]XP_013983882.1 zinc finger matrin-type protein 5 isoform X1 [Salmo salar]XP_013983887.1 zinc finger matrin-type protein 5 isoform X1 [Salmo salar]XP_045575415.1 zinc finger matrin-type protein 5 isoform X1 [Salmo salar]ACH70705.1 zinc finger matrin type 5 [Salmo salar]ACI66837.1 Zinc finger matrin-type protein 5 [Salmo salar]ACN10156.1 Zinc finger matrin-type protein 5 [Salmo salar]ACN12508.1 Zinc finger matrin-type protein 5 [Salmo salar]AD|eukprot:NP_001133109.1 zinc finger matrin-type protein 5 [Salmo salar]